MITPLCRFTFVQVFEPKVNLSGKLKYSTGIMFPKSDTAAVEKIKQAIDATVKAGIASGKFTAAQAQSRQFKYPLRDGDQYYAEAGDDSSKAAREGYKGMFFMNASSDTPIGVVNKYAQPIVDPAEFYSGCWGHADIRLYPFNRGGGIGVGVGLQNVMKKKDDDRLDGRQDAASAFASVAETEGSENVDDLPF